MAKKKTEVKVEEAKAPAKAPLILNSINPDFTFDRPLHACLRLNPQRVVDLLCSIDDQFITGYVYDEVNELTYAFSAELEEV